MASKTSPMHAVLMTAKAAKQGRQPWAPTWPRGKARRSRGSRHSAHVVARPGYEAFRPFTHANIVTSFMSYADARLPLHFIATSPYRP